MSIHRNNIVVYIISSLWFSVAMPATSQTIEEAWYELPRADLSQFTHQDTLRGAVTPERAWWDLVCYHLDVKVDIDNRFLNGINTITYRVLTENKLMQIDLQEPMKIDDVQ